MSRALRRARHIHRGRPAHAIVVGPHQKIAHHVWPLDTRLDLAAALARAGRVGLEHQEHPPGLAHDDRARVVQRVVIIIRHQLRRSPRPPAVDAPPQDDVVGRLVRICRAPFGEREHRARFRRDHRRDANGFVTAAAGGEDIRRFRLRGQYGIREEGET